jgi:hypothetical protein
MYNIVKISIRAKLKLLNKIKIKEVNKVGCSSFYLTLIISKSYLLYHNEI